MRLKLHNGIDTVVYELRPEPTTLGGALNIPSNGLRLFDRLGVFAALAARASSTSQLMMHSLQGAILADLDLAEWSRVQSGFGFMRVLRRDLIDVLYDGARKQNIPVHFGKRMTRIMETDRETTVTFADGTTDTADLLLGCDGIHSAVRTLLVSPTATPEYSGISNMFTVLPVSRLSDANRKLPSALHATITSQGMFGVTPCTASGDHLYWFFSRELTIPGGDKDNREGWEAYSKQETENFKDNLLQIIGEVNSEWADQLREIIQKTDTIKFYPVYRMPSTVAWSTQRCLLIGDAAHAMQPHAGQGTSMALEDVFLLSRLLEMPCGSMNDIFQKYEAIRRPRVQAIASASASRGEMRKTTGSMELKVKELAIWGGFWAYKVIGLQKWGIGMNQKDYAYDIMAEPLE